MTSSLLVWWLYATGIALLLGVAALAAEASARSLGRPARWIWLVALAGSVAVPAIAYVGMPAWLAPAALLPAAVLPATGLITLPALSVAPQAANVWFTPDSVLLVLWAGTSLVLGALLLVPLLRLRAARRRWRRAEVDGVTVWLTHDTGPAAWAGAILLPE
jgi:bla regulator protein blaR1